MNKKDIYQQLADRMVHYTDLIKIPFKDNKEKLVPIKSTANLSAKQIDSETLELYEQPVLVRESVAERLTLASEELAKVSKKLSLEVVYGHRSLHIQQELFEKYKRQFAKKYSGVELLEAVHRNIAVPDVAGHPTGAAVDIRILKEGKPINMGTHIWEFVPDSYTFSPFISKQAWDNRRLLRDVMKQAGFAPYDGEWWHFSYGDKEWAKYYKKPYAIYDQLNLTTEV